MAPKYSSTTVKGLLRQLEMMPPHLPPGSEPPLFDAQALQAVTVQITGLVESGRFQEAYTLELTRMHTFLKVVSEEDLYAIRSLENLSGYCHELGQHEKAEVLLDRVIALRTKVQGEGDRETLGAMASKVACFLKAGEAQKAEELGETLVTTCLHSLGVRDPATLTAMSNLAASHYAKGNHERAQQLFESVLVIRQKLFSPDNIYVVRAMTDLAAVYLSQKQWTLAATNLQSALTIQRRIYGDRHDRTIKLVQLLQLPYAELSQWGDLIPLRQIIVDDSIAKYGEADPDTTKVKLALMMAFEKVQGWEGAARVAEEVNKALKDNYPPGHTLFNLIPDRIKTLKSYASKQTEEVRFSLKAVYQPLNSQDLEIRLINIKIASPASQLCCELVVTSLRHAPPFEALSYMWGPSHKKRQLQLNGCMLNITDNLWHALTQLRSTTKDRLFWVDAISINQMDSRERSSQVELMRDIYSTATYTRVWLGGESGNSHLVMSFLNKMEASTSPAELVLDVLRNGLHDPVL
jgi:tetratricopeptide (TPR) repeat protein